MYAKLHVAYGDFAKANGFMVIPVGTAVQLYRKRLRDEAAAAMHNE